MNSNLTLLPITKQKIKRAPHIKENKKKDLFINLSLNPKNADVLWKSFTVFVVLSDSNED